MLRGSVDNVLNLFDQPFSDTSTVPTYEAARLAAKYVKVLLSGEGGDEVFGGHCYGWYRSPMLEPRTNNGFGRHALREKFFSTWEHAHFLLAGKDRWARRDNFLKRRASRFRTLRMLSEDVASATRGYDPRWAYERHKIAGLDPFRQAQWVGLRSVSVSKMLVKVDRCCMAHSLESRSPLLAPDLIEMVLDMPSEVTNPSSSWFKGLFRRSLQGLVPPSVLVGGKRGFATPRRWSPIYPGQRASKTLELCFARHLIRPTATTRIDRLPKLHWTLLQLERALERGLFQF